MTGPARRVRTRDGTEHVLVPLTDYQALLDAAHAAPFAPELGGTPMAGGGHQDRQPPAAPALVQAAWGAIGGVARRVGTELRAWTVRLAARRGKQRAIVALARRPSRYCMPCGATGARSPRGRPSRQQTPEAVGGRDLPPAVVTSRFIPSLRASSRASGDQCRGMTHGGRSSLMRAGGPAWARPMPPGIAWMPGDEVERRHGRR